MGKRCACAAILDAARGDARLRLVPPGARWLWLMLVDTMARAAEPGVFMIGAAVGSVADMSLMFSVEKVDAESFVESLEKVGLLARRGDGALVAGEGVMAAARPASASRAPVLGRPRKGETPQDYARRQRELRLMGVVAGGLAESQEKSAESPIAKLRLSEEEAKPTASHAVTPELVRQVGEAAAEVAGLDPARGGWTYGVVREWLAAGADLALIVGVIGGIMGRPNPPAARGLGYFGPAVMEAVRTRPAAVASAGGDWAEGEAEAYLAEVERWERAGKHGPMPVRRRAA
jgi:hypothetical protein